MFAMSLVFDFSKHLLYLYGLKEDLIARLELNFSEKVVLCSRNTAVTYKVIGISRECKAIIDERYPIMIYEM